MARNIPLYQPIGVQSVTVPNISFAGLKEQAQMFSGLDSRVNALVDFANEQVSEEMVKEGKDYAIGNPISLEQFYDANPGEKAKLFKDRGANEQTIKGQSIKATLMELLSTDIIMKAKTDMNAMYDEFVLNWNDPTVIQKPSTDELITSLNNIVKGYSDSLSAIDPDTSIKVKAELGIAGNTHLRNFSNKVLTDSIAQTQAVVEAYAYDEIKTISNIISAGTLTRDDGVTHTVDQQLDALKLTITNQLIANNKGEIVDTWSKAWDTEVIRAKKNYLFENFIDKPENFSPQRAVQIYKEVQKGTLGLDVDNYKSIYETLPEDKQNEFKNSVKEWKEQVIKTFEDQDKALDLEQKNTKENLEFRYYEARLENNYEEAVKVIEEAKDFDADLFIVLSQQLDQDDDGGEFTEEKVLADLSNDLIITKDLTHQKIQDAYNARDITLDQKIKLDADLETSKTDAFKIGEKYMRNEFGYSEATIINQSSVDRERANLYREKSNELLDWIRDNSDATATDIQAKVLDLTKSVDLKDLNAQSIKLSKSKLKNTADGFGLKDSSWTNYFKNFYNPEYTSINSNFINDSEGVQLLIDELEELKDMPEGKVLKDNLIFADKKFSRPTIKGKPVTNAQIDDIIVELNYLITLYEEAE